MPGQEQARQGAGRGAGCGVVQGDRDSGGDTAGGCRFRCIALAQQALRIDFATGMEVTRVRGLDTKKRRQQQGGDQVQV